MPLRQIEVENNQTRAWEGWIAIGLLKKPDRLFPVLNDLKIGFQLRILDRLANQKRIRAIVFRNQNLMPLLPRARITRGR